MAGFVERKLFRRSIASGEGFGACGFGGVGLRELLRARNGAIDSSEDFSGVLLSVGFKSNGGRKVFDRFRPDDVVSGVRTVDELVRGVGFSKTAGFFSSFGVERWAVADRVIEDGLPSSLVVAGGVFVGRKVLARVNGVAVEDGSSAGDPVP